MAKTKLERLRRELEAEKNRLSRELVSVGAWRQEAIQSESTSELSDYDNHPADVATETFEREKSFTLEGNIEDLLYKIDSALKRIENNTYGNCLICGGKISPERLDAIPYADLCLDCQARIETQ
jgi:RNA polymerase-binding protein DksA